MFQVLTFKYADGTLLFLQHDYKFASYLKWLMTCFEKLSGMKINFNKSDLISINLDEEESHSYAQIFCCILGTFPLSI
jgi:hypothetical protein